MSKVMRAWRTHKHFTEKMFSFAEQDPSRHISSPVMNPIPSAALSPRPDATSPGSMPRTRSASGSRFETPAPGETSKWLSQVETATHVLGEVPLWFWPQLSFHVYPESIPASEVNKTLRAGNTFADKRPLRFRRLERPGDGVRYNAGDTSPSSAPLGEELLSQLVTGALGATVSEPKGSYPAPSSFATAAWGTTDEQHVERQSVRRGRAPVAVQVGAAWCVTDEDLVGSEIFDEDEWLEVTGGEQ